MKNNKNGKNGSETEKIDPKLYEKAAKMIFESKSMVVLTGAGISTESGIPDFRSPETGLWTKFDPEDSKNIFNNPPMFWKIANELAPGIISAKPNKGHEVIFKLDKMGIIKAVITQNIDGLHQKAGNVIVYELHGNATEFKCIACHGRFDAAEIIKNHKPEDDKYPPTCPQCGSPMILNIVLFDQTLPRGPWLESVALAQDADLLLVVGSSLEVYPANQIPVYTLKHGGKLIIINTMNTDMDPKAEIVFHGSAGKILDEIYKIIKKFQKDKSKNKENNNKIKKIKFK